MNKRIKIINAIINLSIAAYIISFLFLIMRWQISGVFVSLVEGILSLAIMARFFMSKSRDWFDFVILTASVVVLLGMVGVHFSISFLEPLKVVTSVSMMFLIINQLSFLTKKESPELINEDYKFGQEENLTPPAAHINERNEINPVIKLLFGLFALLILTGMVFKSQHYPGAEVLNIVGFSRAAICMLSFLFWKK